MVMVNTTTTLGKKCTICDSEAVFKIKGTSDYYCKECAEENFSDVASLEKVLN